MKHLTILALLACAPLGLVAPVQAQIASPPAAEVSATPTPQPTASPIPLADVVTQADAVEASLQETRTAGDIAGGSTVMRDLSLVSREISAQLAETTQLLKPGVLLETLHEIEVRWKKMSEQLALWTRGLTIRANLIDKQIALLPDQQSTWAKTREATQGAETPPEIRQRIDNVLAAIAQMENALQERRAAILTEQSRVAEQSKRVAGALGSIRAAQVAAVNELFVRESAPIWSPE